QTLPVIRRMSDRRGEHLFVRLSDGTVGSLPAWMFSLECSTRCCLGTPLIAIDALRSLRDLLSSLQSSKDCGKASANPPLQEGGSEEANRAFESTTQPAVAKRSSGSNPRRQTKSAGADRTADKRIARRKPNTRRRR